MYERGTIVGLAAAAVTPAKRKRNGRRLRTLESVDNAKRLRQQQSGKGRLSNGIDDAEEGDGALFHDEEDDHYNNVSAAHSKLPPVQIPKDVKFVDVAKSAVLSVWDDMAGE